MKKKYLIGAVVAILLILVATKFMGKKQEPTELTLAAAASLTDTMNEIIGEYEKENKNVTIKPSYAGSGALQSQIEEGAPIDIFMSAAEKQMNALEEKGLIDESSRVPLLKNSVVLIVPKGSNLGLTDFTDLKKEDVKKVAIADPSSVPIGQYSEEIFTKLGIWDIVQKKMIKAQDVRQSLDWVVQKEVDCATVYKTDAMVEKDSVEIVADAPEGTHKDIIYPMAIIKSSKNAEEAKKFCEYLKNDKCKEIFEKYGFKVN